MSKIPIGSNEIRDRYKFLEEYDIAEQYYDILNNLEHEIQIIDREYNIVFANDKTLHKYGDIVGKKCYEALSYESPEKACQHCPCREMFEENKPLSHKEYFRARDKHGELCYINETATLLRDKKEKPVLAIKTGRDITKRVLLERIKTNIQIRIEQDTPYSEHIKLIVEELSKVGYQRIRFYDVIKDAVKDDLLFVMRDSINMDNLHQKGYRFYLSNKQYYPSPKDAYKARIWDADKVLSKNPENKAIAELGLEGQRWLQLPLIVEQQLVGLMAVDNVGTNVQITNEDLSFLGNFAAYLAQAILAIRVEMNLGILDHINTVINERRPGREILDSITEEVSKKMQAGACQIFLYSPSSQRLIRHASSINVKDIPQNGEELFPEEYDPGQNITGNVLIRKQPLNLVDIPALKGNRGYAERVGEVQWEYVRKYEEFVKHYTRKNYEVRNAMFAPLVFEGEAIGVIRVANNLCDGRFPFPDTDLDLLVKIATQIAAVVQNERMKEEVDGAILHIASSLAAKQYKVSEIAVEIVQTVRSVSDASVVVLFLRDDDKKLLESIAKVSLAKGAPEQLTYNLNVDTNREHWSKGIGLTACVAITGESFSASSRREIRKHEAHAGKYKDILHPEGQHAESLLLEPLKLNNDVIGVLRAEDPEQNRFSKSFRGTFELMANFAALAIASALEIKRKEDFLISLGHELGLPAAGLVGLADVMWKRYHQGLDVEDDDGHTIRVPKKRLQGYCDFLRAEATHLRFLTTGRAALDVNAKYDYENGSLRSAIAEVVSILRNLASEKYIDINFDFRKAPPVHIQMDKEKLKQAFYNVIYNAIKYSPENSDIDIKMILERNNVIVEIIDRGIGVDKEDRNKIFEKNVRGENAVDVDPTGLGRGLYYSKMIIEKHDGKIKLTTAGRPTVFTMIFKT